MGGRVDWGEAGCSPPVYDSIRRRRQSRRCPEPCARACLSDGFSTAQLTTTSRRSAAFPNATGKAAGLSGRPSPPPPARVHLVEEGSRWPLLTPVVPAGARTIEGLLARVICKVRGSGR